MRTRAERRVDALRREASEIRRAPVLTIEKAARLATITRDELPKAWRAVEVNRRNGW